MFWIHLYLLIGLVMGALVNAAFESDDENYLLPSSYILVGNGIFITLAILSWPIFILVSILLALQSNEKI